MTKVFAPPAEVGDAPALNLFLHGAQGIEDYWKESEAYLSKIQEWAKQNGKGPERGKVIRFGVADGQAQYVVVSLRPAVLIHVDTGDAYQFPYIERLTAADLRKRVVAGEAINKLFGKP